jgi:hypothetical protein
VSIAAISAFVYGSCRLRGAPPKTASILTILGMVVALPVFATRPQLFGMVLFAATVFVLVGRDRHPGRLWLLPPIAMAWANLHGSFLFLPALLGLALVESWIERRGDGARLMVVGIASIAATFVNPFGLRVWGYAYDLTTNPIVREWITEWAPTTAADVFGWLFFGSALVVAGFLARRGRPTPWPALLWLGVFFAAALMARRAQAWWGFVVPVVLAGLIAPDAERRSDRGSPRVNGMILAILAVAAIVFLPYWQGVRLKAAPSRLVAAVREATVGGDRLFVPQPLGSWFELTLPDRPVLVDSRIELYPAPVWRDYDDVRQGRQGWGDVLDRWDVDVVVAQPDWRVVPLLRADAGWRLTYRDAAGLVFVRA